MDNLEVYGELETWSNFEIVARHPLANQTRLLDKLGMDSSECRWCDCWWRYKGSLYLVCFNRHDKPGTHVSRSDTHRYSFYAKTAVTPLTTQHIHQGLTRIASWLDQHVDSLDNLGNESECIFDEDLCQSEDGGEH